MRAADRLFRLLSIGLFLGFFSWGLSWGDYAPPQTEAYGPLQDIMLAYMAPGHWKPADFLPYVAYLDRRAGGAPRDWFYDAWLFLMFGGAPSGGDYMYGTAKAADWHFYLEQLFAPDQNLAALEACIEDVGKRLGAPGHRCPVIIMIPYLAKTTKDFGDVDGDGQAEDPSREADRLKACRWIVATILERFAAQGYRHLRLAGFYWMHEGIGGQDEALVRGVADYIHERGTRFFWIPWFRAPGYDKWRELGFDLAIMQPNYAFMDLPPQLVVADEERLTQNAVLARAGGLGVEMELDYATERDPGQRLELQLYLNHGVPELDGYMIGCVRAYYQSYDTIARLYRSTEPEAQRLYEELYRFHKGTYRRRPVSLAEGAVARLNGERAPALTDGLWLCRPEQAERLLTAPAPARAEITWGMAQFVGDVRVHLVADEDGTPAAPDLIRVATSADGVRFEEAAEIACPPLTANGSWRTGFAIAGFPAQLSRALRVELIGPPGTRLGLDEIVVMPAKHLLWGVPVQIAGPLAPGSAPAGSTALTDGRLARPNQPEAGVRFAQGRGELSFLLEDDWLLEKAFIHFQGGGGTKPPLCRVELRDAEGKRAGAAAQGPKTREGWIEIPLTPLPARQIVFSVQGAPAILWDECRVTRLPNLAEGMPYSLSPPFPVQYPDTEGKELTDGLLTERGFVDGRTVGWGGSGRPVSIVLDLGQEQRIEAVRVYAEGGGYAAVHFPDSFAAWASIEGSRWRLLRDATPKKEITKTETIGGERHELAWLRLSFSPTEARFVRLIFPPPPAWLMLSEIEIISGGRNIALGCAYHMTPPRSSAKYADRGGMLTDGDYSRPHEGWSKAVGWNEGQPRITVDLLAARPVGLVRVHCLGGGPGAVYFPRRLLVRTSEDGQHWSEPVEATPPPPEPGDRALTAFLTARLTGQTARYVQIEAERHGWTMIDEIEIYDRGVP